MVARGWFYQRNDPAHAPYFHFTWTQTCTVGKVIRIMNFNRGRGLPPNGLSLTWSWTMHPCQNQELMKGLWQSLQCDGFSSLFIPLSHFFRIPATFRFKVCEIQTLLTHIRPYCWLFVARNHKKAAAYAKLIFSEFPFLVALRNPSHGKPTWSKNWRITSRPEKNR